MAGSFSFMHIRTAFPPHSPIGRGPDQHRSAERAMQSAAEEITFLSPARTYLLRLFPVTAKDNARMAVLDIVPVTFPMVSFLPALLVNIRFLREIVAGILLVANDPHYPL